MKNDCHFFCLFVHRFTQKLQEGHIFAGLLVNGIFVFSGLCDPTFPPKKEKKNYKSDFSVSRLIFELIGLRKTLHNNSTWKTKYFFGVS